MEPVRTCIGSRTRAPRSSLLRVIARDGRVVVDTTATLPGRGAWLIPTMQNFETAVKRKAFRRALKLDSEPDTGDLRRHIQLVEQHPDGQQNQVDVNPPRSIPSLASPTAQTEKAERLMDN